MRILVIISLVFGSFAVAQDTSYVQVDSLPVQNLSCVEVSMTLIEIRTIAPRSLVLGKEQIQSLQANDAGEILQKLPGVNLKSYGGLGGLKTISVRSLGSQHSAISIDGFNVQNSQTGQVNLAQIQTNNLESIALGVGEYVGFLNPVSAQIAGNNVSLQTFEMSFPYQQDSLQIRANMRYGSFGQMSGYAAAKVKIKKGFLSGFGNVRAANGLYDYSIQNGNHTITAQRTNNDYQDHYVGGVFGYNVSKNARFRLSYRNSKIDQGLPGAVIFYNSHADERLTSGDHSMTGDFKFKITEGTHARIYVNGNSNSMRYFDPTYFNSEGFVDVTYLNRSMTSGIVLDVHKVSNGSDNYDRAFYAGLEGGMSDLQSSDSLFSNPLRRQVSAIGGVRYRFPMISFRGHVSTQFVQELNHSGHEGKNVLGINPYAALETRERGRMNLRHRLWYRNSLRVPTFNELYYNNIGNNQLNPERANQFGYNLNINPKMKLRRFLNVRVAGYFNQITDKIVAIPTQNLFTWSIQNVGIVHAFGGEINANTNIVFGRNSDFRFSAFANYSFQRSLNMTDSDHASYRHQIAYIPMHTGNIDVSFSYKQFGGKVTNYLVSKRYSLNQNTISNEIYGFAITDFSLFYNLDLNKKQSLRFQLQMKNAFNKSYSYIRSFIMPGRNYLISINYAFN